MKTELTYEQTQKLIELGIPDEALDIHSTITIGRGGKGKCIRQNKTAALKNLLNIIPKYIKFKGYIYVFTLSGSFTGNGKYISYYYCPNNKDLPCLNNPTEHDEFIDSVFELVYWYYKNKDK